ncbi:transketolase, partial [Candidatus Roizmanbacteria bacterium]|nr:transketolase [Candidatus Roizmanbacteria bacterium]
MDKTKLKSLCTLLRYDILTSTTEAGSGHPTTSLSAVELLGTLFFGGFLHYDLDHPKNLLNDKVIFSKGHASPLLYSLYHVAGTILYEELMSLRKFDSVLEGHPSPRFKYIDVATGSLGQGLSIGVGMAMGIKLKKIASKPKVWVLLGDSEMAEGQIWEAMEIASYYKLNNLIGILDVNRLGQRGETMLGWDLDTYEKRAQSFGWKTIIVDDGHDLEKVDSAFKTATELSLLPNNKPVMIIAKTMKGKGVSLLENKDGWHGKSVPKEMLENALKELGNVNLNVRGKISLPETQRLNIKSSSYAKASEDKQNYDPKIEAEKITYKFGDMVATREAYGEALVSLGQIHEDLIVLDGEVSNSTYAEKYKKVFPDRFFEMFIAEQNMISTALGLSKMGYAVYSSTFAAFLTRTYDQLRIAQYSKPNIKLCGSHAGVSIGEDGPSQMALEDLAMVRGLLESIVLYPSDGVSSQKLTELMFDYNG